MAIRPARALRILALVVAAAGGVLLFRHIGLDTIGQTLGRLGWRVVWLVATYAASVSMMGLGWWALMVPPTRPSPAVAVASRIAASGLNMSLPIAGGGELTRLLWLRRPAWPEAAAALVADRISFGVPSALSLVAGALATATVPGLPAAFAYAALGLATLISVALTAVVLTIRKGSPMAAVEPVLVRLRAVLARLGLPSADQPLSGQQVDEALARLMTRRWRSFLLPLAFHLVGRCLTIAEFYVALRALGFDVNLATVLILAAVPLSLAAFSTLVPGQLGIQEGAQAAVASALGLDPAAAVAMVLAQRARQLMFVALGYALLWLGPLSRRARAGAAAVQAR